MKKGPAKPDLIKRILNELKKYPEGLWIRKLARILNTPTMTIYKYITRKDYVGKYIEIERKPKELGGHVMIKLKKGRK